MGNKSQRLPTQSAFKLIARRRTLCWLGRAGEGVCIDEARPLLPFELSLTSKTSSSISSSCNEFLNTDGRNTNKMQIGLAVFVGDDSDRFLSCKRLCSCETHIHVILTAFHRARPVDRICATFASKSGLACPKNDGCIPAKKTPKIGKRIKFMRMTRLNYIRSGLTQHADYYFLLPERYRAF